MREKYEKSSFNTDIPAALPRQLTVSQRVTARHPVTRQLHDGDVLTIAPDCYRQASRHLHLPLSTQRRWGCTLRSSFKPIQASATGQTSGKGTSSGLGFADGAWLAVQGAV